MSAQTGRSRHARASLRNTILAVTLALAAAGAWWYTTQYATTPASGTPTGSSPPPAAGPGVRPGGVSGAGTGPGTPSASGARRGPPGGADRPTPVSAALAERRDIRIIQPAIGNITALNTAQVRARVDGELRAIHFREGEQVRAGQLLAEIDPRLYEAQLAQAEGQLARDQAQLNNALIDLARYKDLAERDAIARQQVDTQEALVNQLRGTIRVDQAAVDNARLLLSYTRVSAPISGQAGLRGIDLGNTVRAGDVTSIVVITQTQPISVVFAIPEAALPRLRARMRSNERPQVEVWDRELRNRLATGQVLSTDNAIDPTTGTIKVKAQFDNRDGALFPNQFVNVRLHLDTVVGALAVPVNALQRGAAGQFLYLIRDDGSVTVRAATVETIEGEWAAIRADVAPGQRVVTDGADRLREGARVEVIAPVRGAARPAAATSGEAPAAAAGDAPRERRRREGAGG